ncbi:chromosome condensation protein CrcB [Thioalkalivibrio denitrificans]|uniref:Fluoride-specific ion channel FluC n=1 Tax=Thioalkalivibrio denitrificans TaxID=108003 RepID=A0A1V3NDX0_9GAMM|nr:CrcB family protein [Thioalkalivibrio denitrificans]OOG23251.1 chromosome condensation protein CrcB [Thioalkalivibrio denitrificans]
MTSRSGRIYLAVALGSALGAVTRHLVSVVALVSLGPAFAWGTLSANVLGSWLIGLYAALTEPDGRLMARPATRQFVLGGFCGGFTTFSIFSLETLLLFGEGRSGVALLYVAVSLAAWLVAVWAGHATGMRLNRLRRSDP